MSSDDHIRKMAEKAKDPHRFSKDHLKSFVERIERLEEERKVLSDDKRDVYTEAEANGFSKRAIKRVLKTRTYDREHGADARKSEDAIYELYLTALGME